MADSCRFNFSGLDKLLEEFGEVAQAAVKNSGPEISELIVTAVHEEFETEGRGRWAPLAESTKRRRR